ncbi:MAG: hypothetical protein LUE15_06890 [Oscillospiraceae bacterium]|nr:hypothetical protein [Oscillospiraceae bacterium]
MTKILQNAGPDETPNSATLEAFDELAGGGGCKFCDSTELLFAELTQERS